MNHFIPTTTKTESAKPIALILLPSRQRVNASIEVRVGYCGHHATGMMVIRDADTARCNIVEIIPVTDATLAALDAALARFALPDKAA